MLSVDNESGITKRTGIKMSVSTSLVSTVVITDNTVIAMASVLRELRNAQKVIAKQEAEIRADLISALNGSRIALDESGAVIYELEEGERRNADLAMLESVFNEAYLATVSTTFYDKLALPKPVK